MPSIHVQLLLAVLSLALAACAESPAPTPASADPEVVQRSVQVVRPVRTPVVDSDNAFDHYVAAVAGLRSVSSATREAVERAIESGWPQADGRLVRYLEENDRVLEAVRRGAALERCEAGEHARSMAPDDATTLPGGIGLGQWNNLAGLLALEGRRLEDQEESAAALRDYLGVLRMAHHCRSQPGANVASLMASWILEDRVVPRIRSLILCPSVATSDWRNALTELTALRSSRVPVNQAFQREARQVREAALRELETRLASAAEVARVAKRYQRIEEDFTDVYSEAYEKCQPKTMRAKIEELKKEVDGFRLGDLVGDRDAQIDLALKAVMQIGLPSLVDLIDQDYVHGTALDMLLVSVAARLHFEDEGALPATLAELSPNYLAVLPSDPFADFAPLAWSTDGETWLLYSVGPDRLDQNGERAILGWDFSEGGDVVCRVTPCETAAH